MNFSKRSLSLIIFITLLGIIYSLYLFSHVPDEIFYSGDAGIKALLTKQYQAGNFSVALEIKTEPWVKLVWQEGLYPFLPPFVHDTPQGHLVGFPFLFPLMSAPFYGLFGFKGFYVLPLVSLWLLWIRFIFIGRRLKVEPGVLSFSLAILIFSSPLTLYGAMFWEHTLCTLLAFCGLELVSAAAEKKHSSLLLFWGGILAGLSIFIRTEALFLVIAFVLLALYLLFEHKLRSAKAFLYGIALAVFFFLFTNLVLYHQPLGIQICLFRQGFAIAQKLMHGIDIVSGNLLDLFWYFPVLFFLLLYLPLQYFTKKRVVLLPASYIFILSALYIFALPVAVPGPGGKQWGPRYLLILVPMLCLLSSFSIASLLKEVSKIVKYLFLFILIASTLAGAYINIYIGSTDLIEDYRSRVRPMLDFIRQNDNQYIAVSHQHIAQELEASFDEKTYFLIMETKDFQLLAESLLNQGHSRFLFITFFREQIPLGMHFEKNERLLFTIEFQTLEVYELFKLYEAKIVRTTD